MKRWLIFLGVLMAAIAAYAVTDFNSPYPAPDSSPPVEAATTAPPAMERTVEPMVIDLEAGQLFGSRDLVKSKCFGFAPQTARRNIGQRALNQ